MASSSPSISQRCHDIKQALVNLGDASDIRRANEEQDDVARKVSDLVARFELWAGNLGAFQQPWKRLSLDARVAQSPDIRQEILRHLDKIEQTASELKTLVGTTPPGEAHCDEANRESPFDECGVLVELISQSLGFLFRLAVLVRAPGSDSRWSRATRRTDPIPEHFDYNHVISKYPYMDTGTGRQLAKRVAQANVRRRQFVQYCRDHVAHLREETRPTNDGVTEVVSSKATTLAAAIDLNALAVEEFDDEVESLMTTSTTFDKDTKLRLPLLASLSPEGEAFQCPICCALEQFDREKAWKMHAYRDLRVYSCTIGGRDCDTKMFGDRKSWFNHEITQHRSQFTCILCNQKCPDQSATEKHIQKSHGIQLPDQLSMLADSGRTVPTHFKASDCPFCDWPLERRRKRGGGDQNQDERVSRAELKRHIAMHQEQLALFVAPLGDDMEDDAINSDQSAEDISHGSSPAASVDDNVNPLRPSEELSTPPDGVPLDLPSKDHGQVESDGPERSPREDTDVSRSEGREHIAVEVRGNEEEGGAREVADKEKDGKQHAPIRFKDAVGRKFSFPWHLCRTWEGMEELIKQAFLHVELIGPHVQAGHYDLIRGPDEVIILPQVWDKFIEPGSEITMHMWPMDKLVLPPSAETPTSGSQPLGMPRMPGPLPVTMKGSFIWPQSFQSIRSRKAARPRPVRPFKFSSGMQSEPGNSSGHKKETKGPGTEKSTEAEGAASSTPSVDA